MFDNLIANFERPCALDIKLCRYYHGMCSDPSKRLVLEQKSNNSTSSTLGFRIGGMQVNKITCHIDDRLCSIYIF